MEQRAMSYRSKNLRIFLMRSHRVLWASCLVLLLAAVCVGQTRTTPVTLNFEGLQDNEPILNYYNGGLGGGVGGGVGSGPGPNYGVVFGADALAIVSESAGGTGNFSGNPSGNTIAFFLTGPGVIMNVPKGFTTGFSFSYSSADNIGSLTVYDGLDGTGNVLATISLAATGTPCNGSQFTFSCWKARGVAFTGLAKSVNFSGTANQIGFDDITLGSQTPGVGGTLTLITSTLPNGAVNASYPPTTLQAQGGFPPYTWSAAGLPNGLSLSSSGILSGTPAVSGTFTVVVTVKDTGTSDFAQQTATRTYTLTITSSLTITTQSLPAGTQNLAYPPASLQATGGRTPYNWSASGLPAGLSLSSAGVVSGTPSVSGTFSVVVTVTDSSTPALSAQRTVSLTISSALTITTTSLPTGTVQVAYPPTTVQIQGGTPPYTLSNTVFPTGLSLSKAGVISGTPSVAGTFSVTITVNDSSTPPQTASKTYSITITSGVTITTTALPNGTVNAAYPSTTLQAQSGTPPYTWTASGLPAGLSFSTAGVLSGTPSAAGTFSVTITVNDSSTPPQTSSKTYSLTIATAALTITTTSLPDGTVNAAYPPTTLQAQGGTPPDTWTASGLPGGLSLSAGGGLSGTPTASGTFSVTVSVADSGSPTKQTASKVLTISVSSAAIQGVTVTQNTNGAAQNQANLQVGFPQPADTNYTAGLQLSFKPDPGVTNVPSNYVDPAGGFPVSGQSGTQSTSRITINQGATNASIQFAEGTVAGTWTVTLTSLQDSRGVSFLPSPAPTVAVVVPVAPPVVNGTARIVNAGATGFSVQLAGYATSRKVSSATFTFTATPGDQLQGTTATVQFNGADQSQWFNTDPGRAAGGTFSLTVPFAYTGDPAALGSVTAILN
jgi:hypothetical protein